MNFVNSTQIKPKKNFMALIYGPTGIGKTTLALSAPGAALIDVDGGITRVSAAFTPNALVAQLTEWEGYNSMVTDLSNLPCETIVIDTASKLVEMIQHYVMTSSSYPYAKKNLKKPTIQAFGDIKAEFLGFLRGLKQTGKNIIVVAQEVETTKKKGNEDIRYLVPSCGSDKQRTEWLQDMDFVGYMFKDGTQTCITFDQTESCYGKNTCGLEPVYAIGKIEEASENIFFTGLQQVFIANQQTNLDRAAYYAQINEMDGYISKITNADLANRFVAFVSKKTDWLLDAHAKTLDLFKRRVAELNLKLEGKTYVQG